MAFFWCFIVFAITDNQGAARPTNSDFGFITKNGWDSSDESSRINSDEEILFKIPTVIKQGLVITINGSLNTNDKTFTVALPSISGEEDCQIKLDFEEKIIDISPAVEGYESTPYYLTFSSREIPLFSLKLRARVLQHNTQTFGMTFNTKEDGESSQLICLVKNFDDINYIVMKEGVAHIDSLLFEFE